MNQKKEIPWYAPTNKPNTMKNCILFLAIALLPFRVSAWGEEGHRMIALIAYDLLDANTRNKILEDIKSHEFYQDHFLKELESEQLTIEEMKKKWLFSQIAHWPDLIKNFRDFSSKRKFKNWHYINEPIYLTIEDQKEYQGKPPVPLSRYGSDGDDRSLWNISQAYHWHHDLLSKQETLKKQRAESLCWIFHLLGDIHQPLHSTALFSMKLFDRGDKGGNDFKIVNVPGSLHSFWDNVTEPTQNKFSLIEAKAVNYHEGANQHIGRESLFKMDFEDWIHESHQIAVQWVYSVDVLNRLREEESAEDVRVDIGNEKSEEYKRKAREIGDQRMIEAGYRLAQVLKMLYAED